MASSQCCENPPVLNPASGEGKVVDSFGGLKAYLAGSDGAKAAVVLVSDVYGNFSLPAPVLDPVLLIGTLSVWTNEWRPFSSCRVWIT
jgi:hypothetical protein